MARSVMICKIRRIANKGLGGRIHAIAIMTAKISTPMMMFLIISFMIFLFLIVTIRVFCRTMEQWTVLLHLHSRCLLNSADEGAYGLPSLLKRGSHPPIFCG